MNIRTSKESDKGTLEHPRNKTNENWDIQEVRQWTIGTYKESDKGILGHPRSQAKEYWDIQGVTKSNIWTFKEVLCLVRQ